MITIVLCAAGMFRLILHTHNKTWPRVCWRLRSFILSESEPETIFTAHKQSLRRLCFYTCLSVILFTGGSTWAGTPPGTRYTPPVPGTPRDQVHPQAGTPLWPGTPPGPDTPPPGTRYTPWDQVHPPDQVPPEQCMLGDTGNKRAVRILLECILVEILFLEDISPFCGTTDIPVLDFWWHLPWVSKLGCIPLLACFVACEQWIPQIHLWCNTFWPLGSYYYLFDLCRCRYSVWPLDSPRTYLEAMSLSLSHQYKQTLKQKWNFAVVTGRNEVVAKVIFLHLSVILFTGGVYLVLGVYLVPGSGWGVSGRGVWSWGVSSPGVVVPGGLVWGVWSRGFGPREV